MDEGAAEAVARWAGMAMAEAITHVTGLCISADPDTRRDQMLTAVLMVMRRGQAAFAPESVALLRELMRELIQQWEEAQGDDVAGDEGDRGRGHGCVAADRSGPAGGPDEGAVDGPERGVPDERVASSDGPVRPEGGPFLHPLGGRDVETGAGGGGGHGGTPDVTARRVRDVPAGYPLGGRG